MAAASSIAAAAVVAGAGASIYSASQKSKAPSVSGGGGGAAVNLNSYYSPGYVFGTNQYGTVLQRTGSAANVDRLNELGGKLGTVGTTIGGLRGQLDPIRSGLAGLSGDIQGLRQSVTPGFGRLTESRVKAIRDASAESIGNLRDSLARRNVLGSSFAEDAVTRTRLAYAQEEEKARAESALAEVQLSRDLIQQQAGIYAQQLGLTQAEADLLSREATIYQGQAQILASQLDRELQEMAVGGNLANGVQATVAQQGIAQAQFEALANARNAFNQGYLAQHGPKLVSQLAGGLGGLFGGGGGVPAVTPGDPTFGAGPAGLGA